MDLARARRELEQRHKDDTRAAAAGSDATAGTREPVVVCAEITRDDFQRWLKSNDGELGRWEYEPLTETTGRVLVYSLTYSVHETSAHAISCMVMNQLDAIDLELWETIFFTGALSCNVGRRRCQRPDQSFRPVGAASEVPTVIVEVNYRGMPLDQFENKLHRWIETWPVQVVIGIDIEPTTMQLIMLQRVQAHPNEVSLSIETRVWFHDLRALPADPVVIPWTALYHGVDLPGAIVDAQDRGVAGVTINFRALRKIINADRMERTAPPVDL